MEPTLSRFETAFERWRQAGGLLLAPVAFFVVYRLTPGHLQPEGCRLAAILASVAVLWVTEAIPLPVTAILGACLCVLLGVADAKTVFAPFADPIVFLFIGSFILAQAMTLHGLDRRLALAFLSVRSVSAHPSRVLFMFGAATALVSMWVSNTATTAMMMPIALGVLRALQPQRGSADQAADQTADAALGSWPFATSLVLMVAYAASVGGIATPVGSPPNLICIAQLRKFAPECEISFFQWMALMLPIVACMYLVLYLLLRWSQPRRSLSDVGSEELGHYLRRQRDELGPWSVGQVNTFLAFSLAVALWVTPGVLALCLDKGHPLAKFFETRVPEAVVALLAALLLFVLPTDLRRGRFTIGWQEAVKIDWGTILLFGGGLSLGGLMFQTGVAEVLGRSLTDATGLSGLWSLTALAIALGIVLSELSSNTASANMLIPVVIALALGAGVNPVPPALGACLGASYGFMLPVSTPPNAIAYGTGLVPIPRMIRTGLMFDICGFAIILLGLRLLWPLLF